MLEETKKKISERLKGRPFSGRAWSWKGKKLSVKHREALSQAKKQLYIGKGNPFYGKKHTKKTREKMRQAKLGKKQSEIMIKRRVEAWLKNGIRGEKHWNWKGGITPLVRRIRFSKEYKKWKREVLKRDKKICRLCGAEKSTTADHYPRGFKYIFHENNISSFKEALECKEFWNIENGRTVCEKCHKKTVDYGINYSKKPNQAPKKRA